MKWDEKIRGFLWPTAVLCEATGLSLLAKSTARPQGEPVCWHWSSSWPELDPCQAAFSQRVPRPIFGSWRVRTCPHETACMHSPISVLSWKVTLFPGSYLGMTNLRGYLQPVRFSQAAWAGSAGSWWAGQQLSHNSSVWSHISTCPSTRLMWCWHGRWSALWWCGPCLPCHQDCARGPVSPCSERGEECLLGHSVLDTGAWFSGWSNVSTSDNKGIRTRVRMWCFQDQQIDKMT